MPTSYDTNTTLGLTACWTASVRAQETQREDRLFADPWAEALAGAVGAAWIAGRPANSVIPIVLRTRFFDDFLQRCMHEYNMRQIVMLAAGLDTRAYRLAWPPGTTLYELDRAVVLQGKQHILDQAGAQPACQRHAVSADLATAWRADLLGAGFEPGVPTGWLLEGFLFYVPNALITHVLDEVSDLAAPGSWLGFDIVNSAVLTSPLTRPWVEMQASQGAPWLGTMDQPVEFLAARGWEARLTQAGQPDANHGRWPFPVIPVGMPDMPHNWFVTAQRRPI